MTLNEAVKFLKEREDFLLLTHRRPDGDTVGSAVALCLLLRRIGKKAWLFPNEDLTERFAFLYEGLLAPADFCPETCLSVDVAAEDLLPESAGCWKGKVDFCIDHHPSNQGYAARSLVDPSRSATGELIWELAEALEGEHAPLFCQAVYTAIATDTGCFCYPNTTPRTHRIAALCMEGGADFARINKSFFEQKSMARFAVEKYLFENLRFYQEGKVAAVVLYQEEMDRIGADRDAMDNLASLPRQVEGVCCSIVLTQVEEEKFKASVRTGEEVDASRLCGLFGGGGHARAAGCALEGTGESCLEKLTAAARKELGYV